MQLKLDVFSFLPQGSMSDRHLMCRCPKILTEATRLQTISTVLHGVKKHIFKVADQGSPSHKRKGCTCQHCVVQLNIQEGME